MFISTLSTDDPYPQQWWSQGIVIENRRKVCSSPLSTTSESSLYAEWRTDMKTTEKATELAKASLWSPANAIRLDGLDI